MGRIAAPHGVHGALKVKAVSADPAALLVYDEWWLRRPADDAWAPRRVRAARAQGTMLVVEFCDIESREQAAALRGADVGVPRARLPEPGDDEYYQGDLVGMRVVNRDGVALGVLDGFVESGAHPIARVVDEARVVRLIPWVDAYIDAVEPEVQRIVVDWPENHDAG